MLRKLLPHDQNKCEYVQALVKRILREYLIHPLYELSRSFRLGKCDILQNVKEESFAINNVSNAESELN